LTNPPFISFVIPFFNESLGLSHFIDDLHVYLKNLPISFELIFIDDGSIDDSMSIIEEKSKVIPLKCIKLSRNFGKEKAITAGLNYTQGDAVVIIDADGQHPLHLISVFIQKWQEGYDMVYGIRSASGDESCIRRFFTKLFYKAFSKASGLGIESGAGDFRLMDQKIVKTINLMQESSRFMKGIYSWVGFKKVGVPFNTLDRRFGSSTYNMGRLFRLARVGITSFSTTPLRLSTYMGLCISIISSFYAIFVVLETLIFGIDLPGWSTLVAGIFLLGGIQLLFIGILGEYIGHIFKEVKKRPNFIVD
jgi:glycosyltransferase involved in cell wall biosynthesis